MGRINHFIQNRPVHLALRDVYYERAVEQLLQRTENGVQGTCVEVYEEILFLLRTARQHARFANREDGKHEQEELFCEFMNVLSGNVKAVLSMLNLKRSVENAEGFFLSSGEANHASVGIQAEDYARRARDVLRSVRSTLDLAHGSFEELKRANMEQFSEEENARYERAYEHYRGGGAQISNLPEYEKKAGVFD